jgi:hypothetical protein
VTSNIMTKGHFDQFKSDMLRLSQAAGELWDKYNELKTSNDMVIRLAKKQKCQMDLMAEDRQKTIDEIKVVKLALRKAREKIKHLEKGISKSKGSKVIEPVAVKKEYPQEDTLDLEMLVNDIDTKLAIKEEEQTFNYLKKMDLDF